MTGWCHLRCERFLRTVAAPRVGSGVADDLLSSLAFSSNSSGVEHGAMTDGCWGSGARRASGHRPRRRAHHHHRRGRQRRPHHPPDPHPGGLQHTHRPRKARLCGPLGRPLAPSVRSSSSSTERKLLSSLTAAAGRPSPGARGQFRRRGRRDDAVRKRGRQAPIVRIGERFATGHPQSAETPCADHIPVSRAAGARERISRTFMQWRGRRD